MDAKIQGEILLLLDETWKIELQKEKKTPTTTHTDTIVMTHFVAIETSQVFLCQIIHVPVFLQ